MAKYDASYPRAILHFDGDSFFASVEQAKDWRLRGKPVVTGGERGAATSLSIEAKARGLHRAMPIQEIRRLCPDAIVVAGDYTAYSIYAHRMYAIAREFTPLVEDYSIDECFADITGLHDETRSYEDIARAIKDRLESALGITFGVGLAPTKTLAKIASKRHKPAGFTALPQEAREAVLRDTPIQSVWGLGGAFSARLRALGVHTAYEYTQKSSAWLSEHEFVKPARATWLELRGYPVLTLHTTEAAKPKSVMKTRTFAPPSTDRALIFAQLSKNVEAACAKVRRAGMHARGLSFYLKTQEFTYHSVSLDLPMPTSSPRVLLPLIDSYFNRVYAPGILYRATGVTLRELVLDTALTPDLFGVHASRVRERRALAAQDAINRRHGRHTIVLASSLRAHTTPDATYRARIQSAFLPKDKGEKKRLNIPHLGSAY